MDISYAKDWQSGDPRDAAAVRHSTRHLALNITYAVRPGAGSKYRELLSSTITEPT